MMQKEKVKKPLYKRTWFIVLCAVAVVSAISSQGDKEKPAGPANAASVSKPAESQTQQSSKGGTSAASNMTTGQKNALGKAKSYLNISAFSYRGLIEQLEFEKFSNEDSVYAADNCGADWNEQAAKNAKSYLNISAFSHSGLVEQLEFEGFTSEQAAYGVESCNADWNEQAAKKAKSYLDMSSFSRDMLIAQLEFEGFTHEQAAHGAKENGY